MKTDKISAEYREAGAVMQKIVRPLVDWYKKNARTFPWRENITPYKVWVSEIMLQQTRIEAARGYFVRFMDAFPTVQDLANADIEQVLKLWEGLGYYSRARNLHKCARLICNEYGGKFPENATELRKLPGIGDYTAGAVASIAFGKPEPAVDGNVLRVYARLNRCADNMGDNAVKNRIREELRAMYPAGECAEFTSALMELGEVACTPGVPDCSACPLAEYCNAHEAGEETDYPVLPPKKARRIENKRVFLMLCGDKCAVHKRPDKGLLAGLWELPNDENESVPEGAEFCGETVHVFTHVEWHMRGYILRVDKELPEYTWVTRNERLARAIPSAFRFYVSILDKMGY